MVHAQQNGFLQILESVHLDDCGDIRAPFPAKLLQALKNLKSVEIEDCKSLEEVFELGEADEGSSEEKELPLLSSLTKLHLSELPQLKCIWKGPTRNVSLQSLVVLKLDFLDKLTFIFTTSLAQSLPKLERLSISECGELKHIIREEDGEREIIPESPRFPQLKSLLIYGCGKLEYVFTVSVSPSLPNLEEMTIDRADNLKQIFYSGEGDALPTDFIIKFPRLRSLSLSNCSFFGPRNFAAQLPSLQYLNINGHKELGNLCAQLQGLTNLETLYLKSLPDMRCIWKGLVLSKLTTLEMAAPGEQNGSLQRLECVRVNECGDVTAKFLQINLKTLKELIVASCKSLEEVFELGEADEGSSEEKELLSSLTELQLSKLPELKCIWKGPTGHVSLRCLAHLYLDSLDKLAFIFTPSLAQSLPKLESLRISDCGELKHIIREEDGEREIIPESSCFPELKTLNISFCDKLEYVFPVSLSHNRDGIIKFPQLRKLSLELRSNYSFLGPRNFDAQLPLKHLTIEGHEEVGNWLAQLQQNGFLQRLESVHLDDCGDVRAPFPAKLLQALKNLESVKIKDCKSLEEVFELGEADEGSSEEKELPLLSSLTQLQLSKLPELKCIWKGPTGHVSLRSLACLYLDSLDKLAFIFTPSLAQRLPKLESLRISDCGELKHIIREEDGEREIIPESPGQDDQASPVNVEKEIVLPNLKELSLEQLSSIVCFSFGWCDYFLFPCLEKLKVHQCPKLTTKFATTRYGSMSAQSEVSEVAEDSSINREWTRDNGWKEDGDSCL
ncbi:uncharacterized protein [Populus alba]|uniref:Disease resistance protein At4g27190-like leucine-rich repeats domain-containing protein n=2 Tax=Populus alba TaxID=43335 RepID=A0A4V6A5B6_POPAL|nr:uncharacterized protein LOC118037240 isoform X2 [Populus alba]TKR90405.1 hypothetical protein D5086_0000233690 [Populus alba]